MEEVYRIDKTYRIREPKGTLTLPFKHLTSPTLPDAQAVTIGFDARKSKVELVFRVSDSGPLVRSVSNCVVRLPLALREGLGISGAAVGEWIHTEVDGQHELRGLTDVSFRSVGLTGAPHLTTRPLKHTCQADYGQEHFKWYLAKQERSRLSWPQRGAYRAQIVKVDGAFGLELSVDSTDGVERTFGTTGNAQSDLSATPPNVLVYALNWVDKNIMTALLPDTSVVLVAEDDVTLRPVESSADGALHTTRLVEPWFTSVEGSAVPGDEILGLFKSVRKVREAAQANEYGEEFVRTLRNIEMEVERVARTAEDEDHHSVF